MNLLLDTCALLWLTTDTSKLSSLAREEIGDTSNIVIVSAISAFEIGLKHQQGKLELEMQPAQWWQRAMVAHGLRPVPIHPEIALRATCLPTIHRDPCDRLIIATALCLELKVITADPIFSRYPGVQVVW